MRTNLALILMVLSVHFLPGFAAAANPIKTILISDIDDTIKDTQVRPADTSMAAKTSQSWHLMNSFFNANDSFIGISSAYMALAANGLEVHYVSGSLEIFGTLAERFLQSSGFPEGHLWLRPDLETSIEDFKIAQIQKIMLSQPQAEFIMIGDNGQRDVTVYRKLKADPRFKNRIREVYIHHLYSKSIGETLAPEQKTFISAADLSLQLFQSGRLTEGQTFQILKIVDQGIGSQFQGIQQRTFPAYETIDMKDLAWLHNYEEQIQSPTLRSLFHKILSQLWKKGLGRTN